MSTSFRIDSCEYHYDKQIIKPELFFDDLSLNWIGIIFSTEGLRRTLKKAIFLYLDGSGNSTRTWIYLSDFVTNFINVPHGYDLALEKLFILHTMYEPIKATQTNYLKN